jgi:hypothetical protein
MPLTNLDKQDLRHAVLKALYDRQLIPLTVDSLRASARRLVPADVSAADVLEAVTFHVDLKNAEKLTDEWGAEDMYKITAKGIIAHERDPKAR